MLPLMLRILFSAVALLAPVHVAAQELLSNRNFEAPQAAQDGNNFYSSIPNWTLSNVTPPQSLPFNIVKPHSGYAGNPHAPPSDGDDQYFDVASASGTLSQTVSLSSGGTISISGWFSVRDFPQAITGTINVRNSSNVVVATASTSFTSGDPIGLWKQASAVNIALPSGIYTFQVVMPNYANFDLASMVLTAGLSVTKTSLAHSDPISGANPKMIPGAVTEYSITATSPPGMIVTNNTLLIVDTTPANTALVVSSIGGAGSGPAAFTPGSSSLTYSFTSLASTTDDIEFSSNNGVSWTYTPVAGGNGTDPMVTRVRLRPKGTMSASSTWVFKLRYRVN